MLPYPHHPRIFAQIRTCSYCFRRQVSSSPILSSGHSKWATIRHDKARNDKNRGKQNQALAAEIAFACRELGPDPVFNPRLVDAIARAKKGGLNKVGIETAVLRGQGKSSTGATLEPVTIEAVVPPVALVVEALTASKARTMMDVKLMLKRVGGSVGPAAYLFEKRGRVTFAKKDGFGLDQVLNAALEAGAVDILENEEGRIVVDTEPSELKPVEKSLIEAHKLEVLSADTVWLPNEDTKVQEVEDQAESRLLQLQDDLNTLQEVNAIYMNFDLDAQQSHAVA